MMTLGAVGEIELVLQVPRDGVPATPRSQKFCGRSGEPLQAQS